MVPSFTTSKLESAPTIPDSGDVAWTRNKEKAVDHALQTLPNARAHWFRPAHHDLHAQHPERFAEVLVSNLKNGFLA